MLETCIHFGLGLLLVTIVSAGPPPKLFGRRCINLLAAIPGSLSMSSSMVSVSYLNSDILTGIVLLMLLYILTGTSKGTYLLGRARQAFDK